MNRRDVLVAAGAGATVLATGATATAKTKHTGHSMPANAEFRAQAEACLGDGHACLEHCLELLAGGDTSVAACAKIVKQMLAICAAVGPVATTGSKHAKALAELCHDVCVDCKAECDKHSAKHALCKKCGESCEKMIAVTKKVLARG